MKKITTFWNHFLKNEQEILNALLLGLNTVEVLSQLAAKLDFVSKNVDFVIKTPEKIDDKFIVIFTGKGYRKLFQKIKALEKQAPEMKNFTAQAFIKPMEDLTVYKNGTDLPCICKNFKIKISEVQLALLDYNITTKHLKLNIYLPEYNKLKHFDDLKPNIEWIIMQIIGEIVYRKHIKEIQLNQLPLKPIGLLSLIELPDFIAYLYQINSRKKTRRI